MVEWRKAACKDIDPETFFPISETGLSELEVVKAKKICGGCAIAQACLEWAVITGEPGGIWGGQTESERRKAGYGVSANALTHKEMGIELDAVRAQRDAIEEAMRREDARNLQKQG